MPFALALPVALSAIQSLIKFRGRVDTILSLHKTTEPLPFLLPEIPADHGPHIGPMLAFFGTAEGAGILSLRGLEAKFTAVSPNPNAGTRADLILLLNAYYDATDVRPNLLGPDLERFLVKRGSIKEARLAYYVVESERLSQNPAVTRVLLAAADTLLEFGAEHATQMIANPQTRLLVQSLLTEFAQNRDWDDAGAGLIFKTLLGSTALAVLQNPGSVPDKPVAQVLFAALRDVEKQTDTDFVAKLVTREGFHALVGRCLIQAASQPGLLPDNKVLQPALAAMLKTAGENLDSVLLRQPGAIEGVLEAGLAVAATTTLPLIDKKLGNQPLLAAVFKAVLSQTQSAATKNELFASLANGVFLSAVYKVTLQSVAANPKALAAQAGLDEHVATLIGAWAGELANAGLNQALSTHTLRTLAIHAMEAAAQHPEFLGARGALATKIVGAALAATGQAAKNGFTHDDLLVIADTVVRTAAMNLAVTNLDQRLKPVIAAFSVILSHEGLSAIATASGRKELFFAGMEALASNPKIWGNFAGANLVQPLVTAVVSGLATDPSGLLSGPALVPAFQRILAAAALKGQVFLDKKTTPAALQMLLTAALKSVDAAIGQSIDDKILPQYLQETVRAFLTAPFDVSVENVLADWVKKQLPLAA